VIAEDRRRCDKSSRLSETGFRPHRHMRSNKKAVFVPIVEPHHRLCLSRRDKAGQEIHFAPRGTPSPGIVSGGVQGVSPPIQGPIRRTLRVGLMGSCECSSPSGKVWQLVQNPGYLKNGTLGYLALSLRDKKRVLILALMTEGGRKPVSKWGNDPVRRALPW